MAAARELREGFTPPPLFPMIGSDQTNRTRENLMKSKNMTLATHLPTDVSKDGKTVTMRLVGTHDERIEIVMRSPDNAALMRDLQNADALARDRFLGRDTASSGGLTRLSAREPKTVSAIHDSMLGRPLIVFDHGLPTEMTYMFPKGAEAQLAQAILKLFRELPDQTNETRQ
jgi:hypothetical protein